MLIKTAVLDKIKAGPHIPYLSPLEKGWHKSGRTQLTQSGLLAIDSVDV
jgi:hypothetical protein